MFKKISTYLDLSFLARFLCLFIPAYYFHTFYLGITDPNNYYSPFLDKHLNYINWLTASINNVAKNIVSFFGIHAETQGKTIFVENGARVLLEFPCLGLGLMTFWFAFVVAHKNSATDTIKFVFLGVLSIWIINCCRIAILLIALQNNWKSNSYINHHDLFNLFCYALISLFVYLYYLRSENRPLLLASHSEKLSVYNNRNSH